MRDKNLYGKSLDKHDTISPLHIPLYVRHGLIAEAYELALRLVGGQSAKACALLVRLSRPPKRIEDLRE